MRGLLRLVVLVSALCISGSGCNSATNLVEENSTLKPLMVAYGSYLAAHRGVPPASEAEFKAYVDENWQRIASFPQGKKPEDLFISNRDKQPYVILYGAVTGPPGPAGQPVIAYEKTGVRGKRLVASALSAVEEVDEARFKQLVPAPTP